MNFIKYAFIGVINTFIHVSIFFTIYYIFEVDQSISNFCAFISAVSFHILLTLSIILNLNIILGNIFALFC